jgi:hypothetical protein
MVTFHKNSPLIHPGIKEMILQPDIMSIKVRNKQKILTGIVLHCKFCQRMKSERKIKLRQLIQFEIPNYFLEFASIDILGPMHKTFYFKYMTVVVDRLTKYIWAKASKRLPSSEDLMSMLPSLEQETGNILKQITSDRGSQFCSRFWTNKCKSKQLISIKTSVYHPQADGITERAAQNILNKLRLFSVHNEKKWYKNLQSSVFPVNISTSAATRMVRSELIKKIAKEPFTRETFHILSSLNQNLCTYQDAMRDKPNSKRRIHQKWIPGTKVLISSKLIQLNGPNKLGECYHGPYPIISHQSPVTVKLDLGRRNNSNSIFHVSYLKKFYHKEDLIQKLQNEYSF